MKHRVKLSLIAIVLVVARNPLVAESQADRRIARPFSPIFGSTANFPWARVGFDYSVSRFVIVGLSHDAGPEHGSLETNQVSVFGSFTASKIRSSGSLQSSSLYLQLFPFEKFPVYGTLFVGILSGFRADTESVTIQRDGSKIFATWTLGSMEMESDRFWGAGIGYRHLTTAGYLFGAEFGISRENVRMSVHTSYVSTWVPSLPYLVSLRLNEENFKYDAIGDGTVYFPRIVLYCGVSI